MVDKPDVTRMLNAWSAGDPDAGAELLPYIYSELKRISRAQLRASDLPVTMQATELVNEAYLRLAGQRAGDWNDRTHFFALASTMIRRVLLDYARKRCAQRRDRRMEVKVDDQTDLMSPERAEELVQLDEALAALHELDEPKARLVELRYFGGLTIEEAAEVLDCSASTVKRDWKVAKAFLYRHMTQGGNRSLSGPGLGEFTDD
jgi:RNA polymerase sigma factor (TIGR02999 family)